jgi:flagellar hook assembly protein FlgD
VTIELFDFGMNRVRTLLRNAQRSGTAEHDEIWDGKNDGGSFLPNGVYFYRVTVGGNDPAWGKVMVLQ